METQRISTFRTILPLIITLASLIFPLSSAGAKKYTLFRSGKTRYTVVCPPTAQSAELRAAERLCKLLSQVSGCTFPLSRSVSVKGPAIYVSGGMKDKAFAAENESFRYYSLGADIFITGGSSRGTLYGVCSFLEREFGVRWYAPDCTVIPKKKAYSFSSLSHFEKPALQYRYCNYYQNDNNPEWSALNRENMKWSVKNFDYCNFSAYNSCHTMGQFMPAGEFFASHPEYFALRYGKRISNGQLCLSNPDVLRICTERLLRRIHDEPGCFCYSLSQNDNQLFCQCDKCKTLEEKYGGHSGLLIWFVNQAADAVKTKYPGVYVGTFAYQYTRTPPTGIVPRDNVVIRLCSIECCFSHPIRTCPRNASFVKDLEKWKSIAPHLFIWDYIVDYAQYMAPWPNFSVMADNIRLFSESHAIGVFEEAEYEAPVSEFHSLRAYIVDRLLWDPTQNADTLARGFISAYYGKAAPEIWQYYRLTQSLVKPDTHMGIFIRSNDPIFTDDYIGRSRALLDEAMKKAGSDSVLTERVEKVMLQILFLASDRNIGKAKDNDTWALFKALGRKYRLKLREVPWDSSIEDYIKTRGE